MNREHSHPACGSSYSIPHFELDRHQTPNHTPLATEIQHTSTASRTPAIQVFETSLSLPQTRLQLESAELGAAKLSSHNLGGRISRWFSNKDKKSTYKQISSRRAPEEAPATVKQQNSRISLATTSVLREVSSSNQRRNSDNNVSGSSSGEESRASPTHSWYEHASSTHHSPVAFGALSGNASQMKLREFSDNAEQNRLPIGSPCVGHIQERGKRDGNRHRTSFPASEYIAFIEAKFEEVERSQCSPNTGLPIKEKLRAITAENNRLQETVLQLERQFEERLRESVEHKIEVEVGLRRKIKVLEEEVDSKNWNIQDLEQSHIRSQPDWCNAEAYKLAIARLKHEKQALEESSRNLEKRNDTITELLIQSPSRIHRGIEMPSPTRYQSNGAPRPISMMPRINPSPTRKISDRSLPYLPSPSPLQTNPFTLFPLPEQRHSGKSSGMNVVSDAERIFDDVESNDSGFGDSCSLHSASDEVCKRPSMQPSVQSHPSASSSLWGLPLPLSPSKATLEILYRKRKTRRFASGSTQLKPLVLPRLNTNNNFPRSSALPEPVSSSGPRDDFENSICPIVSAASCTEDFYSQRRHRSKTWAAENFFGYLQDSVPPHLITFDGLADRNTSKKITEGIRDSANFPLLQKSDLETDASPDGLHDGLISELLITDLPAGGTGMSGDKLCSELAGGLSSVDLHVDRVCSPEQLPMNSFNESETTSSFKWRMLTAVESQHRRGQTTRDILIETDHPIEGEHVESNWRCSSRVEPSVPNDLHPAAAGPISDLQRIADFGCECGQDVGLNDARQSLASPFQTTREFDRATVLRRHPANIGLQPAGLKSISHEAVSPYTSDRTTPSLQSPFAWLQSSNKSKSGIIFVTKQTMFGTILQYSSYISELRQDLTALARRVLANAWRRNRTSFGSLGWWVFGLSFAAGWKKWRVPVTDLKLRERENQVLIHEERTLTATKSNSGFTSCQRACLAGEELCNPAGCKKSRTRLGDESSITTSLQHTLRDANSSSPLIGGQKMKEKCAKLLYLWAKFSFVIVFAVVGAVINGPEEMMQDYHLNNDLASNVTSEGKGESCKCEVSVWHPPSTYIKENRGSHCMSTGKSAQTDSFVCGSFAGS